MPPPRRAEKSHPTMRTDQYAHQQATRVAGIGVLAQLAIGLVLLIVGRVLGSTPFVWGSLFAFAGIPVWATLAVVFHQHRLAALEAAEAEELRSERGDSSVFDRERASDVLVAARRLQRMYQWLLPTVSLAVAAALAVAGGLTVRYVASLDDPNVTDLVPFKVGEFSGWQLAVCVGLSLATFIFSRFVAGMAKQPVWQNLRGGAGYMVGTALVLSAIGIGVVADVFGRPRVLETVVLAIGIGEIALAGEIVLNFILALYRPRRLNEIPRAAFDSRVLSLFAAPDSIVRSINEAVNYQFGFDITSSWGYQLMLRSVAWLLVLGAGVLLLLSCVVVVPPGQQAVRMRGGAIVGDVAEGTLLVKLPWPFESVELHDVARIRSLALGGKSLKVGAVNLWDQDQQDTNRYSYLVAAPAMAAADRARGDAAPEGDASSLAVTQQFALVDADIVMNYRVRDGGLLDWLAFSGDSRLRRSTMDMRERTLRDMALREVTRYLSTQPLSDVLSPRGDSLVRALRERIQAALDAAKSGVEVVAVQVPALRPPAGEAQGKFEEASIQLQNARLVREEAERQAGTTLALLMGSQPRAAELVAAVEELRRTERAQGADSQAARDQRARVEMLVMTSRGIAASVVAAARSTRWSIVMGAASDAAEVLGQAPSFHAAPELYKEYRTMQVLGRSLQGVRVKYVLGPGVERRADLGVTMKQPESGLNLADYMEKKDAPSGK